MDNFLFAPFPNLKVEDLELQNDQILVRLVTTNRLACCPYCKQPSSHLHSHYSRTLADIPCADFKLSLLLKVRRLRCQNAACSHRTFAEPVEELATRYARRTLRQSSRLRSIGLTLGGEAGARLAQGLGLRVSPATLLRIVKTTSLPAQQTPRVLGVDEFAWRRGHHYGTLLYDLEQKRPLDLLPDRSANTFADWLKAHPGISIISRDRASGYGEGARRGAPQAIQVADRWHLLDNLIACVRRIVGPYYASITNSYKTNSFSPKPTSLPEQVAPIPQLETTEVEEPPVELKPLYRPRQTRRQYRLELYQQVKALKAEGLSHSRIAQKLKANIHTVRKYARAQAFAEQAKPAPRASQLERYRAYLTSRWEAGCHNYHQLWRELAELGYRGSFSSLYAYLRKRRTSFPLPAQKASQAQAGLKVRKELPTVRQISWWLTAPAHKLEEEHQVRLKQLVEQYPALEKTYELVQVFGKIVRERKVGELEEWLERVEKCEVKELTGFAFGIRKDQAAVEASLEYSWNNGAVEGTITRLKLLKRQGYGRANLELLRARLIGAA